MLMHTGEYLEEHTRDCRQVTGLGVLGKRSGVETPPFSVIPGTDEERRPCHLRLRNMKIKSFTPEILYSCSFHDTHKTSKALAHINRKPAT